MGRSLHLDRTRLGALHPAHAATAHKAMGHDGDRQAGQNTQEEFLARAASLTVGLGTAAGTFVTGFLFFTHHSLLIWLVV
jgi:hypothetical protein